MKESSEQRVTQSGVEVAPAPRLTTLNGRVIELPAPEPQGERVAPSEELIEFFKAHRPLPYLTGYPESEKDMRWYGCTCKEWSSEKRRDVISEHWHILEFEKHMADALIASGWEPSNRPEGSQS